MNKALENADEAGGLLIDLQLRKDVSMVGLVCRCTRDEISRTSTMDDGTGMIVVQDFSDDYGSFEPALELHTYAYVVGRVMISENEISAFCVPQSWISIRFVLDFVRAI
jgi:hypothetical protein